jgi:hypothetical protein
MDRTEDRLRALEQQVSRYRILTRVLYITVGLVLVACAAYVISNLLRLQAYTNASAAAGWGRDSTLRARRLEIFAAASSRPVCVLRAEDGGGRIEVFDRNGNPLAGFDGNRGLVVRSADGSRFPE